IAAESIFAASARPRLADGRCPASDKTARSAHTAPTTALPAPSRPETLPAASSWHSAQIPWSPASTASSPNPTPQSTPPALYHNHCSRLLQRFARRRRTLEAPKNGVGYLAGMGHEDQFLRSRLSDRYRFRKPSSASDD